MAVLLQDPSIKKLAGKENYFPEVIKIISMYTGLKPNKQEDKEILVRWGRSLFSFMSIGAANKLGQEILFKDFAEYLKELKSRFKLALVTTQPQHSAKPILSALGYAELFDYVYESSFYEKPDKFLVLKRFVNENSKPLFYIGNSKEDI